MTGVVAAPVLAEDGLPGDVLTACGASCGFLMPLNLGLSVPFDLTCFGSILIPVLVWIVISFGSQPLLTVATRIRPINAIVFISLTPEQI